MSCARQTLTPGLTVCVAEDRPTHEPAVRLLILSLERFWPGAEVNAFCPWAGDTLVEWSTRHGATIRREGLEAKGWDAKPAAMLRLLGGGYREVVWIDADIIAARPLARLFEGLPPEHIVAAEAARGRDRKDGDALRTKLWGMRPGRTLGAVLNTGVVRATAHHRGLLARWRDLLASAAYRAAQARPWPDRPIHMLGDQDVLTALLCSAEFSSIPVRQLRRGREIVQFAGPTGYTTLERLAAAWGGPPALVHAIAGAGKPWVPKGRQQAPSGSVAGFWERYYDLSPYKFHAEPFRASLGIDSGWAEFRYRLSRILRAAAFGSPAISGLPFAALADLGYLARRIRRGAGRPDLLRTGGFGWAE